MAEGTKRWTVTLPDGREREFASYEELQEAMTRGELRGAKSSHKMPAALRLDEEELAESIVTSTKRESVVPPPPARGLDPLDALEALEVTADAGAVEDVKAPDGPKDPDVTADPGASDAARRSSVPPSSGRSASQLLAETPSLPLVAPRASLPSDPPLSDRNPIAMALMPIAEGAEPGDSEPPPSSAEIVSVSDLTIVPSVESAPALRVSKPPPVPSMRPVTAIGLGPPKAPSITPPPLRSAPPPPPRTAPPPPRNASVAPNGSVPTPPPSVPRRFRRGWEHDDASRPMLPDAPSPVDSVEVEAADSSPPSSRPLPKRPSTRNATKTASDRPTKTASANPAPAAADASPKAGRVMLGVVAATVALYLVFRPKEAAAPAPPEPPPQAATAVPTEPGPTTTATTEATGEPALSASAVASVAPTTSAPTASATHAASAETAVAPHASSTSATAGGASPTSSGGVSSAGASTGTSSGAEPSTAGASANAGLSVRGLLAKAATARQAGDAAQAKSLYEEVLARSPRDAEALTGVGDLERAAGDKAAAAASYDKALATSPTYLPALLGAADLAWDRGDKTTAGQRYAVIVGRFPPSVVPPRARERATQPETPASSATSTTTE